MVCYSKKIMGSFMTGKDSFFPSPIPSTLKGRVRFYSDGPWKILSTPPKHKQ
ncbi:hypothetical protein C943_01302 [Mariniradius saccharolyticus AK6]|uniref:Uncharacterized protein n=1 Tax=Mariniradius saccharolyticus AK6 TaxID=1239962 RepID=M7X539_9BACT|nr:hypothetical protein C943_01302 [Mariniradius saccharolyticus AK6]